MALTPSLSILDFNHQKRCLSVYHNALVHIHNHPLPPLRHFSPSEPRLYKLLPQCFQAYGTASGLLVRPVCLRGGVIWSYGLVC